MQGVKPTKEALNILAHGAQTGGVPEIRRIGRGLVTTLHSFTLLVTTIADKIQTLHQSCRACAGEKLEHIEVKKASVRILEMYVSNVEIVMSLTAPQNPAVILKQ